MPRLVLVGFLLDLAGLVGLAILFGEALDPAWCAVLAGFLPAIASAVSAVAVGRARGIDRWQPQALFAFAISGTAFLLVASALLGNSYMGSLGPLAIALGAQTFGWCCLAAVAPQRPWRCLVSFVFAMLVVGLHVLVPLAECMDAFGRGVADHVLVSDVESDEELHLHRAKVRDWGVEAATTFGRVNVAIGAVAFCLLLVLWRRPRPAEA